MHRQIDPLAPLDYCKSMQHRMLQPRDLQRMFWRCFVQWSTVCCSQHKTRSCCASHDRRYRRRVPLRFVLRGAWRLQGQHEVGRVSTVARSKLLISTLIREHHNHHILQRNVPYVTWRLEVRWNHRAGGKWGLARALDNDTILQQDPLPSCPIKHLDIHTLWIDLGWQLTKYDAGCGRIP